MDLSVSSSSWCLGRAAVCDCGTPTDHSKAIPLLRFFFVYEYGSVVSYVAFVLYLFVSHLSYFWCLGTDVLYDCGIFWVSSLIVQGPVVQSVVSLTNSLVVKLLTALVRTQSNSHVFLLKECE